MEERVLQYKIISPKNLVINFLIEYSSGNVVSSTRVEKIIMPSMNMKSDQLSTGEKYRIDKNIEIIINDFQ